MTKTTLRELSSKYKSVLVKCALLNVLLMVSYVTLPAQADFYGDGSETKLTTANPEKKDFSYTYNDDGVSHTKAIGSYYIDVNSDVSVGKTNLVLNGGVITEHITGAHYVNNKTGNYIVDTTNIIINNTKLGGLTNKKTNNGGYFYDGIFAGSYTKYGKSHSAPVENTHTNSQISTTNLTITAGRFDVPIFAGSGVSESDGAIEVNNYKHTASVTQANMNVTGGTFNEGIAMGGFANVSIGHPGTEFNRLISSTVDTSNLIMDGKSGNLNIASDIYAGGTSRGAAVTSVSTENADIKNTTIQNFYGYNGAYKSTSEVENMYNLYSILSKVESKPVNTNLTLSDVTAQNVEIPVGTVTLNATGENTTTLNKLVMGDDTKLTLAGEGSVILNNDLTVGNNTSIDIQNGGIRGAASISFGDNTALQTVLNPNIETRIQANSVSFGKNNTLTVLIEDMESKEYDFIEASIIGRDNLTLSENFLYEINLMDSGKLSVEKKEGAVENIVADSDMDDIQSATTVAVVQDSKPTTAEAQKVKQMMHKALQQGDMKALANIADKINPTIAPVQQSVETNTMVMGSIGNRLSVLRTGRTRMGISGG